MKRFFSANSGKKLILGQALILFYIEELIISNESRHNLKYLGIEPSTTLNQLGILGLRRQRVPSVRLSLCASSSAAVLLVDVTHGESSHFARAGERGKEGEETSE